MSTPMNKYKISNIQGKIILIFSLVFLLSFSVLILIVSQFSDEIYILLNTNRLKEETKAYAVAIDEGREVNRNDLSKTVGGKVLMFTMDGEILDEYKAFQPPQAIPPELFEILQSQNEFFIVKRAQEGPGPKDKQAKRKPPNDGAMFFAVKTSSNHILLVIKHLGTGFEAARIYSRITIWSSVFIYCLSLIIITLVTRRITKPILDAKNITHNFANMDLHQRLDESRSDELGDLNRSINIMAKELTNNFEKLNEANENLSIELSKERTMDKMRRRFVADVSHELKNPITMIQGYADALIRGIPDTEEDLQFYYETISDEANRMDKIVRDLLDLSAYESGTFKLTIDTFDIIALTRNIVARFSHIATEKNITIIDTLPDAHVIIGDQQRIGQVLVNLLSNAFKHVPESGHIKLNFEENTELQVALTIGNTGRLIPEEDIDHIFESFYRADNEKKGHGLGLAIVKSIVKLHKGNCKAYTEDNFNYFEIVI